MSLLPTTAIPNFSTSSSLLTSPSTIYPNLPTNITPSTQPLNTTNQTTSGPNVGCSPHMSVIETVLLTLGYIAVFIVSIAGNAVIIYIVCCYRNIKTAFNILIVNMAAADILDSLVASPANIAFLTVGGTFPPGTLGSILCKMYPFLQDVSISASVLTLTVIAVDRYFAIVHVLRSPMGVRAVRRAIAAIWLSSAILFSYDLYVWRGVPNNNGGSSCSMHWDKDDKKLTFSLYVLDTLVKLLLHYVIPLVIMIVFYTVILLHLWQSKAPGELTDNHQRRLEKQKRKIVKMLVTIVTAFAVCWLPVHVHHCMLTFNFKVYVCTIPLGAWMLFYLAAHANAAINPCLYLIFNQNFRDGLKHLYHKVSKREVTIIMERTSTMRDVISGATAIPNIGYHPSTPQLTRLNTSSSHDEMADSRL